jgi:hypothetical protein
MHNAQCPIVNSNKVDRMDSSIYAVTANHLLKRKIHHTTLLESSTTR